MTVCNGLERTDAKALYKQTESGSDLPFYAFSRAYNNILYSAQYSNGNISSMKWNGKDETAFTKGLSFTTTEPTVCWVLLNQRWRLMPMWIRKAGLTMSRTRPRADGNMLGDGNRNATLTYNYRSVGQAEPSQNGGHRRKNADWEKN